LPFFSNEDWTGKRFLDVGCGMGRNSLWPMKYGATSGVAVDIDDRTLAAAQGTLAAYSNVQVAKYSAYALPGTDAFDIVFSIGVIHHLEFPATALDAMVKAAKVGGTVAIWVYGRENNGWILWALDPARKILFSRLPVAWVNAISLFPAALLWLLLRCGFACSEYLRLLRTLSFWHLRSIVFDQLMPRISNYWRKDQVEAMMVAAGLRDIELAHVNGMSWAARGRKTGRSTEGQ